MIISKIRPYFNGGLVQDCIRRKSVSDPRRLEKTIIAPHIDLSAPPGLRSSIQNKTGTHQLVLSALLGCPIAISAPSSDTYIQANYGAIDNGNLCQWNLVFRTSRAKLARLPLYCFFIVSAECALPTNASLFYNFCENFGQCPSPS